MTDDDSDVYDALSDVPLDADYIDPPKRRAEIDTSERRAESRDDDADDTAWETASADSNGSERRTDASDGNGDTEPPAWNSRGRDYSHAYDRSGKGLAGTSWDIEIDDSAPQENDGRSQTRTGFDPREAPDVHRWKRLARWQDGERAKERDTQNKRADRQRWVDVFCDGLEMVPAQKERVRAIVNSVDISHMAHYSTEIVILTAISLVANEDGRWIRDEKQYRTYLIDVGASLRTIRKCRRLLSDKSDLL